MPRRGYRLDRDGNQVPPWAPSRSTNYGYPTPRPQSEWDHPWPVDTNYGKDMPSNIFYQRKKK